MDFSIQYTILTSLLEFHAADSNLSGKRIKRLCQFVRLLRRCKPVIASILVLEGSVFGCCSLLAGLSHIVENSPGGIQNVNREFAIFIPQAGD